MKTIQEQNEQKKNIKLDFFHFYSHRDEIKKYIFSSLFDLNLIMIFLSKEPTLQRSLSKPYARFFDRSIYRERSLCKRMNSVLKKSKTLLTLPNNIFLNILIFYSFPERA